MTTTAPDPPTSSLSTLSLAPSDAASATTRHHAEQPPPPRTATVLYATETGTSLSLAETLRDTLLRKRFTHVHLASLDEYDVRSLAEDDDVGLVVFIVSVTGQGEFPTSARAFWKLLLRADIPPDALDHITFAAFGCGDSSYPRFNWPVRMLSRRLQALGASPLVEHGEGDEQHYQGIDGTFLPWSQTLTSKIDDVLPLPPGVTEVPEDETLPPRIEVRFLDAAANDGTAQNGHAPSATNGDARSSYHADPPPAGSVEARLTRNERITSASHFQDVRLLTFESASSSSSPLEYETCDVLHIRPRNAAADVDRLLIRLGWDAQADAPVQLHSTTSSPLPPSLPHGPTTLRTLLTEHLDPFSVPRRAFFDFIRRFSPPGSLEREKLDEFVTPGEGADEMYEYAQRVRRTMAEVLYEFKSVQVEPLWALELFPLLRERAFSIASSPLTTPGEITLCIALVTYKTRLHDPRWGVCSRYLSTLPVDSTLRVRVGRGTMRLPPSIDTPLLLIGPGTGVAPLRSLLHSRIQMAYDAVKAAGSTTVDDKGGEKREEGSGKATTNILLLTGCRYRAHDWAFGSEWESLTSSPSPSSSTTIPATLRLRQKLHSTSQRLHISLAASRDGPEKEYVQHLISSRHSQQVWNILSRGGFVYLCGSAGKMTEEVREAVMAVAKKEGGMEEEQAKRWVEALEVKGRWQEECWS